MIMGKIPDWLKEPDIRTFSVESFTLDYIADGARTEKVGYLLTLCRNGKIRRQHFFTNKKHAKKYGTDYTKNEDLKPDTMVRVGTPLKEVAAGSGTQLPSL
jgi:hypothetical protein